MLVHRQKEEELRVVEAARKAGLPLPIGEVGCREEPDFQICTEYGLLGMEVTEVLPPPRNASFTSALAERAEEVGVVGEAEEVYRHIPGAPPIKVTTYFWNIERRRGEKHRMANELVKFVSANRPISARVATFERRDKIPDGFGVISIVAEEGKWYGGGRNALTLSGLRAAFSERITDKNQRVHAYRENLPGAPIWLLLYSGAGLPGGIEMFSGVEKSSVVFDFDRVFFFSALAGRVVELHEI